MADTSTPSTLGKLNKHDLFNGLIMAVGAPLLTYLQTIIPNYDLPTWLQFAIGTLITYLLKNVFTDNVKIAQKIMTKAAQKADNVAQVQNMINPVIEAGAKNLESD
jgi:hypothetical protein